MSSKATTAAPRYDYELIEHFEAGIELVGSEVKSLRGSTVNLQESYAAMKGNELFLINSNIPEYREANRFNHDPKRPRRLLLHRKQIDRLSVGVLREGLTNCAVEDLLQYAWPGEGGYCPRQGPQAA